MFNSEHWRACEPGVAASIINLVNTDRDAVLFEASNTDVRQMDLPFYPRHRLYELSTSTDIEQTRYFLVSDGTDVHWMNWRSPPIYAINRIAPLTLPACDDASAATTVAAYLRFFCCFLKGEDGVFFVVESPDDPLLGTRPSDAAVEQIRPLALTDCVPDAHFDLSGSIVYGNKLYSCTLRVHRTKDDVPGLVEMLTDETLPQEIDVRHRVEYAQRGWAIVHRARRQPISTEELLAAIKAGVEVSNRELRDADLKLTSQNFTEPVVLRNCEFRGGVDLSQSTFEESVEITNCTIRGSLTAAGAKFRSSLHLYQTEILAKTSTSTSEMGVIFRHASIEGDLLMSGLTSHNTLDAYGIRVQGRIICDGITVAGEMSFSHADISGLFCDMLENGGTRRAEIEGHLRLDGMRCSGRVRLEGTKIHGALIIMAASIGAVQLNSGNQVVSPGPQKEGATEQPQAASTHAGSANRLEAVPVSIGCGMFVLSSEIASVFRATATRVSGDTTKSRSHHARWMVRRTGCVLVEKSRVGGDVVLQSFLCSESAEDASPCDEIRKTPQIARDVVIRHCAIEGELDLRGLTAGGTIDLTFTSVSRNVRCSGHVSERSERPACRTSAGNLMMEQLRCTGDLDLSGLTLTDTLGGISGRSCCVEGRFQLYDPKALHLPDDQRYARLRGALDLTSAKAHHLIFTGDSFEETAEAQKPSPTAAIVFQHANFNRLELHDPPPRTIDLRNVQVEWWDFANQADIQSKFEQLLSKDTHKFRSTYVSIEQSLFKNGHREAAEHVRRLMFRSLRKSTRARAQNLPGHLGAATTRLKFFFLQWFGYSRVAMLVAVFIFFLILNSYIFSDVRNVGPSAEVADRAPRHPPAAEWRFLDGLWTALNRQAPMFPINVQEEWRPARTALHIPHTYRTIRWLSAESWGALVTLGAWFWWAIMLLSIAGTIRRAGLEK